MNHFDNLYFEIDPLNKIILNYPKKLEHNWNNISGIVHLPEEKLYDLSWAGYENFGFLKIKKENIQKIEEFSSKFDILTTIKSYIKEILIENLNNREFGVINVNNKYSLQLTDKYKISLTMKYMECISNKDLIFNWKTLSGYVKFNSKEFIILFEHIQKYIQKLYDEEENIIKKINSSKDIFNLLNINLELKTSNEIIL